MSPYTNISIDMETLGRPPSGMMVSLAAVPFNPNGHSVFAVGWHMAVEPGTERGTISADTVRWWLRQEQAARDAVFGGGLASMPLREMLTDFIKWMGQFQSPRIWCKPPTFDATILCEQFTAAGFSPGEIPFDYIRGVRCIHTVIEMAEYMVDFDKDSVPFGGVEHDAMADAVHQARVVQEALAAIGRG